MTKIYFVRHAEPIHSHADDRTRPLSEEGQRDTRLVLETLRDKKIEAFYCSPYKRSIDTIKSLADHFGMQINTDERLRERDKGKQGNDIAGRSPMEMFRRRWADHDYHEQGGESIRMVRERNIAALDDILAQNDGKSIVIGTHGTALSAIINHFRPDFGLDDFLRIIDWMPYILEMDIEDGRAVDMIELAHIEKEFKGK